MNEEELVGAIVANPDDEAAWMVYADWLLEREHPRGEMIHFGRLAEAGDAEARWQLQRLEANEDPLLSPRLAARAKQWRFGWRRGFLQLAEFQTHASQAADAESLLALCADPHAALLKKIVLAVVEYRGPASTRTGLGQRVHARADVGDLDRELAGLRWLQWLDLHGVACSELSHRHVRRLRIDSITCGEMRIDLPALETLIWRVMSEPAGFGTVLRGPLPNLRSLGIENGSPRLVEELAGHRVARQLETLAIEAEDFTALGHLVNHGSAFPQLRKLRIDGFYGDLGRAETDALRAALERAYPKATLEVKWERLVTPREQPLPPRPPPPAEVDEQSRRADGTIDAAAHFIRRLKRPRG